MRFKSCAITTQRGSSTAVARYCSRQSPGASEALAPTLLRGLSCAWGETAVDAASASHEWTSMSDTSAAGCGGLLPMQKVGSALSWHSRLQWGAQLAPPTVPSQVAVAQITGDSAPQAVVFTAGAAPAGAALAAAATAVAAATPAVAAAPPVAVASVAVGAGAAVTPVAIDAALAAARAALVAVTPVVAVPVAAAPALSARGASGIMAAHMMQSASSNPKIAPSARQPEHM